MKMNHNRKQETARRQAERIIGGEARAKDRTKSRKPKNKKRK